MPTVEFFIARLERPVNENEFEVAKRDGVYLEKSPRATYVDIDSIQTVNDRDGQPTLVHITFRDEAAARLKARIGPNQEKWLALLVDGQFVGLNMTESFTGKTVLFSFGVRRAKEIVNQLNAREIVDQPAIKVKGGRDASSGDHPAIRDGVRRFEVWAMDADGQNVRRVAHFGDYTTVNSPEVSPDGKFVAVDGWRADQTLVDARVLILDVESGNTIGLCKGAMPTWSPDGKWISFCRYGDERGVYIRAIDSGAERLLDERGWGIQWSPDGLKVAYSRDGRLVIHNFVSDTEREINPADWDYTYIYWNATWSPNSKEICFRANCPDGRAEFAIVSVDGDMATVKRRIDANDFHEDIAWYPGGSRILIPRRALNGEHAQIYEFDPEGTEDPKPVKGQPKDRNQGGMCWTRDGKTLYFISRDEGPKTARPVRHLESKADSDALRNPLEPVLELKPIRNLKNGPDSEAADAESPDGTPTIGGARFDPTSVRAVNDQDPAIAWDPTSGKIKMYREKLAAFKSRSQQLWDDSPRSTQE